MAELTIEQQRALALARARVRARQNTEVPTLEGAGRAFVQGGTFGLGDELVAAGVATRNMLTNEVDRSWGEVYDASLENQRQRLDSFRDSNPVAAYGAELGGALIPGIATGGVGMPGAGAPLGARMLAAGGNAFAQGNVYGFNAAEGDFSSRLLGGLLTGGISAPLGAMAPLAGAAFRALTQGSGAKAAATATGSTAPAVEIALRSAGADDVFSGAGAQRLAAAGPDAMLADAGPSFQTLLDTASQTSGPAANTVRTAVEQRANDAAGLVTQALDNAFGQPAGLRSTEMAIRTGTAQARDDAYRLAYSRAIDYTTDVGRQIDDIVASRVPKEAIDAANRLMRAELGRGSQQIMAEVAEDGTVTFREMPDVQQLDYITRGLNEVAFGPNGQTSPLGRIYGNLSRDIRDLVKQAVPEYATALATAAEPIQARNALQFGATVLRPGVTRDEVVEMVGRMSDAERSFVAQGIRAQLDEALANVKAALTDSNVDAREAIKALRDLSSRASQEKVATVIGNDKAGQLFRDLERATLAFELRAAVARNSATFARTEANSMVRARTEDGIINAIRSGQPVDAARRIMAALGGRTANDKQRIADADWQAIAQLLTGPRGKDALNALIQMQGAQQMMGPVAVQNGLLAQRAATGLAAPLANPMAGLLTP